MNKLYTYLETAQKKDNESKNLPNDLMSIINKDPKTQGRSITKVIKFTSGGDDFDAISAAQKKAEHMGYSYGSMQRDDLIALAKGKINIAKWRNIGIEDRTRIDGVFVSNDMRNGDVYMVLFIKI